MSGYQSTRVADSLQHQDIKTVSSSLQPLLTGLTKRDLSPCQCLTRPGDTAALAGPMNPHQKTSNPGRCLTAFQTKVWWLGIPRPEEKD